ncbi:MAG TPA: phospholipid carrier-dependent glycosyltransferase [Vicinamibacterales bacterium]
MTRRCGRALAAIVALAAVVRFWGLGFGLPYTQARPDETIIIGVVLSFLHGRFAVEFYDYPWLYMWALTAVYFAYFAWGVAIGAFHSIADLTASWPVHWEPFFLLSRALSATLGTATVAVVFAVGRRLWDETTGLLAALFLSLAFLHVRDSHFGTTDIAMTFLLMVAMALLLRSHLGQRNSFLQAGVAAGFAAATKYPAALLVVPAFVSDIVRRFELAGGVRTRDRRLMRFGIGFSLAVLVGVPFVLFDTQRFLHAMDVLKQSTTGGQGLVPIESGWIRHLRLSLRYGVGLPMLVTAVAGMVAILVRTPAVGAVLFAFPLVYYAVAASMRNVFFRYAIPIVPFLCLAAARLICLVVPRVVAAWPVRLSSPWRLAAPWIIGAAVVAPSALSVYQFDRIVARADNRVVVARWFEQHVPPRSSVLQSGSQYGHAQFDPGLNYTMWVWNKSASIFVVNGQPAVGQPDWILVQDSPLPSATQPFVTALLRRDYAFVQNFVALSRDRGHLFDQQDAFYVPYAGFTGVERPGPNFALYKRVGAPAR